MLKLQNISVRLKDFNLEDINLEIKKGQYHVLLGPSGSGKTVLLNTVAGFHKPESGKILLNNTDISAFPPEKRNLSLLFQDLALFPHLNVYENLAFPLKMKNLGKPETEQRVDKYLGLTEISHLKFRDISKLSGGERQRVALARILVAESGLLLLDEPFSAIDTQLKLSFKKLLRKISASGVTIIHVTHDLEESINLADSISVIENGKIIQSGPIHDVLNNPVNSFIASFTGQRNYYNCSGIVTEGDSHFAVIDAEGAKIKIEISPPDNSEHEGIIIDSNNIIISDSEIKSSARNNFKAKVESIFRTRQHYEIEVDIGIKLWINITAQSFVSLNLVEGAEVYICFKASEVKIV